MAAFLSSPSGPPAFVTSARQAVAMALVQKGAVAVWASREPRDLAALAAQAGVVVYRVEDGFIRSAGLGADFIPPASITVDADGLYFDPTRPSRLEKILDTITLDAAGQARAHRLVDLLIQRNVTKYAAGAGPALNLPSGLTILVPGQVEDDRSVLLGGAGITSNLDLLRRVRAANPTAHIVYKPHPDVEAGHRPGAISLGETARYADITVRGGSMAEVIMAVDEVHCLTSLAGFEALLRGKRVVVYGQPFYAGWGLTDDINPPPRRGRALSLAQLVSATLIDYPLYFDPLLGQLCGPETLIERLEDSRLWQPTALVRYRQAQGRLVRHGRRLHRMVMKVFATRR